MRKLGYSPEKLSLAGDQTLFAEQNFID